MKKINLLLLLTLLGLWSCESVEFDDEAKGEALSAFQLSTPEDNASLVLNAGTPNQPIVIKWTDAKSGLGSAVKYSFIAARAEGGSLDQPLLSLPADNDGTAPQLTVTHKQLDDALKSVGVADGVNTDLIWSVKAEVTGNTVRPTKSNRISIRRFGAGLSGFSLLAPATRTNLVLDEGNPSTTVAISWEAPQVTGSGSVTYTWVAVARDGNLNAPLLEIPSDNSGTTNTLTLTHQQIDNALATAGIATNASINLDWAVNATLNGVTQRSNEVFKITFKRFSGGTLFRVYVPANTPTDKDVFIAGALGFLGAGYDNWQQPGTNPNLKLTKDTDGSYYIRIPGTVGQSFEYKFFLATTASPDWSKGEQVLNYQAGSCEGLPSNRSHTFVAGNPAAIHNVEAWEGYCPSTFVTFRVTVPANTPSNKDVFLAGEWGFVTAGFSDWQQPGTNPKLKMFKDIDGTWFIKIPYSANRTHAYKYFLATTTTPDWGSGEQARSGPGSCSGTPNRSFAFTGSNTSVNDVVQAWEGLCF